ncbi:MAG: SoxR reducing system RseC family protein [Corallococcus sp.]|nr:SoxR reducing system RseC family protein [Corallococcus sp.]MCM1359483.1 SoxR reducing system RseC family protein [Corallococcus sp.]MCM1394705.1 SoxR reducing system RseC family protein [Corallococcus sp.]
MTERGYVLHNKNNFSKIRIGRNSACAGCGKCGMTEKQKHMDFYVENVCGACEGDVVELEIPDVNTVPLAFVAYIVPLVPAVALMLISVFLNWAEWVALLAFFGGLVVGVAILALIDKLHKHRWAQSPTMKAIIYNGEKTCESLPSNIDISEESVEIAGENVKQDIDELNK